jgi:hypothetical protein
VTREELVLAVLAVGGSYQMSRLLKTVFLVSRNISEAVEPTFGFDPSITVQSIPMSVRRSWN